MMLRICWMILMLVTVHNSYSQTDVDNLRYLMSEGYTLSELEELLLNMPVKKSEKWMEKRGYTFREEVPSKKCLVFKKGEVVTLYAFYSGDAITEIQVQSSPQKYYQAVAAFKDAGKYKQVPVVQKSNMTTKEGYKYYRRDAFLYWADEDNAKTGILFNYPPDMKQQFKSSYLPEMVLVKGGEFTMGADDEDAQERSKPSWDAEVTDFYIGKYEITVREYLYFCKLTGRTQPKAPSFGFKDNYPIGYITWHDANDYCDWLSYVTGKKYRLPYEAEWEFAARGGTKSKNFRYAGSDFLEKVGWLHPKDKLTLKACGSAYPNELGLYDMSTNVWEWCADWYDKDYYSKRRNTRGNERLLYNINPKGANAGTEKMMRGGTGEMAKTPRVTNRLTDKTDAKYADVGFRIVLEAK